VREAATLETARVRGAFAFHIKEKAPRTLLTAGAVAFLTQRKLTFIVEKATLVS